MSEVPTGDVLRIEPAGGGDAEAIARCNEAMARETEGLELDAATVRAGVRAVLAAPRRGFYLVARTDAGVAGCLLVTYEWSDWRNGSFWWIQSVYVHPPWRRRGVYRRLYADLQRRAREAGALGFRLYVEHDNRAAKLTYRALGMHPCRYHMYEALLGEEPSGG